MKSRKYNIGIVLSGGAARGFTHLGVFKSPGRIRYETRYHFRCELQEPLPEHFMQTVTT